LSSLSLAAASAAISAEFIDLVDCPPVALATVMPDGSPQTSVVWCDFDGTHVRVNTMRGFRKEKNMRDNPKVTLLCYDPTESLRCLEVRGTVVEMTEDGAMEHLDRAIHALRRGRALLRPLHRCQVPRDRDAGAVPDPAEPGDCIRLPRGLLTWPIRPRQGERPRSATSRSPTPTWTCSRAQFQAF
jgi:hypothetical protein